MASSRMSCAPSWLFRLFETSNAESLSFDDRTDAAVYIGRHHGYERLPEPVTHERTFRFEKTSGALLIVDRLIGRGRHAVRWHFHLAPGVSADRARDDGRVAHGADRPLAADRAAEDLAIAIEAAAYSPSYGVQRALPALDLAARGRPGGRADLGIFDRIVVTFLPRGVASASANMVGIIYRYRRHADGDHARSSWPSVMRARCWA